MCTSRRENMLRRALRAQEFVFAERERIGYDVPYTVLHQAFCRIEFISYKRFVYWLGLNLRKELRDAGLDWREIKDDMIEFRV